MTAPVPFPDPSDREALRRWKRENRRASAGGATPATPEAFASVQRGRLFRSAETEGHPQQRRRLDVALTGAPTVEHTVRVSTLGPFLTNLQESVSAVAQALTGRATSFSSIPRTIRDATALSAVATFPSSFGVAMYGPPIEDEQSTLFPEPLGATSTVLDEAVETVLDVMDVSESLGQSDDPLAERLVPLGQRAMKHLGALTAGLTDADLGLSVTWHTRSGRTRHSQWSTAGVMRVREVCEHSEFARPETVTITGWLGSASAFRGTVEILTDSRETIRASTDENLASGLHEYFNKRVEARVEVTRVRSSSGREREIYTVLDLRNV